MTGRTWPKTARLLRRGQFQRVYQAGRRLGSPLFMAFALPGPGPGSRIGFTTPRALGKAVDRNRMRRKLREAVRLHFKELSPGWDLVLNPRREVAEASRERIEAEVRKLFRSLGPVVGEKEADEGTGAERPA